MKIEEVKYIGFKFGRKKLKKKLSFSNSYFLQNIKNWLIFLINITAGFIGLESPRPSPIPSRPNPHTTIGLKPEYVTMNSIDRASMLRMALKT